METQLTYNKESILSEITSRKSTIKQFGVSRLGLFGSFVRSEQTSDSDLDFYVEFLPGKKSFINYMDLAFFLEDLFERKIDLITDKAMSERFRKVIEKELEYVSFDS